MPILSSDPMRQWRTGRVPAIESRSPAESEVTPLLRLMLAGRLPVSSKRTANVHTLHIATSSVFTCLRAYLSVPRRRRHDGWHHAVPRMLLKRARSLHRSRYRHYLVLPRDPDVQGRRGRALRALRRAYGGALLGGVLLPHSPEPPASAPQGIRQASQLRRERPVVFRIGRLGFLTNALGEWQRV